MLVGARLGDSFVCLGKILFVNNFNSTVFSLTLMKTKFDLFFVILCFIQENRHLYKFLGLYYINETPKQKFNRWKILVLFYDQLLRSLLC